jgi:hypothetical protein
MAISHVKSITIADGTDTNIVRPSDWNSAHNMFFTLSGNTNNASTVSGQNIVLSGGPNITLIGSNSVIGISGEAGGAGGVALSAGTQSVNTGTVAFANSNGVTFGMSGSNQITASVLAQSVQTQGMMSLNGSTGQITLAVGSSLSSSVNGSTITFGLASNITTALQSAGAYLTTAAQSGHSHGNPTLNLTNLSGTTGSNSAGLTLSLSAAAQSVQTQNSVQINGSSGAITLAVGSSLSSSTNGSTITFGLASNITTALQSAGNYLTTAALSNHSHGVTLNLTNINGTTGGNSAGINLSLSAIVPSQTVQPVAYSAANGSANFSTLTFANSNGVSFSTGTQGLFATVKTDYLTTAAQSGHSHGVTLNLTNLAGTTGGNSAGITLSLSATAQSVQPVAYSAANGSAAFSTLTFANSNGVSFSTGTQGVYATVKTDYLTTAAQSNQVVNSLNGSTGAVSVAVGSSLSASSNASTITFGLASNITTALQSAGNYLTTARASNDAIGLNSALTANGVSMTANSAGLSLNFPAFLTTAAQSGHSHGNPTLNLTNLTGTTASNSAGFTLSLSAAPAGGGGVALSAGTQSVNTGTVAFANSNGITFGMSGSNQITASHNGLTTAALSDHSHGVTLNLTNINGTTGGNSAGINLSLSAIVPAQTVQTQGMVSINGSTGNMSLAVGSSLSASSNASTITFGLASNITTALQSAGAYLTTARASNDAVGLNTAITAGPLAATINSGGISLNAGSAAGTGSGFTGGASISATITHNTAGLSINLSHPAWLTTAAVSNHSHGFSASGGSSAFQTLNFANSNGFTFSNSNGSVIGSYTVPAATVFSNSNNVSFGLNGSTVTATATFAQTNQTLGLYAVSNTVGQSSSSTFDARTLSFHGAGIASVGYSGGSVVISVPSGGGAGDGYNSAQFTNSTANSTQAIVWAGNSNGSGNITMGLTGSTVTASAAAGAGGTATMWQPFNEGINVAGQVGNASMHIVPLPTPTPAALGVLEVDRLCLPLILSNATNSTGTVTLSYSMGLYTRRSTTQLSLVHSISRTLAVTFSGTVNNSTNAGIRLFTIPWTTTIEDGRYYVAQWSRTTTGGANCSLSQLLVSQMASNFSGFYGVATNRSQQWPLGYGVFSASVTTAMPSTIAFSQIDGTASLAARPPSFFMISSTA